jgi:SAM-dependent methyltransferase
VPRPTYELSPCPVCGETRSDEIADEAAIRSEVEALWEFHGARLYPATPPIHLADRVCFSLHPPLRVARCVGCGLIWRNPPEREFEVRDIYAGESPDVALLASLFDTQRAAYRSQTRRLTEVTGRAGRVLEVGSYVGGFLAAATEAGWDAVGVDVNASACAFAQSRELRAQQGDLSAYDGPANFDALAFWNCFDQLPDPAAAAHRAHALLAPHGILALRVPNGAFYAAVRKHLGTDGDALARALLAHNNLLTFPYRHGFTLSSLRYLLDRTGFEIIRVCGDTLVPIADEWTKPWAAFEERAVKGALCELAAEDADKAPWVEVFARRTAGR